MKVIMSLINETNGEGYELRSNTNVDVKQKDNVIALYSLPNSLELFFLCTRTNNRQI